MATILLQAAGAALGGMFGLAGKAIGMAAGSLAGYVIDKALINSTKTFEGARLSAATPLTAEEGTAIPRLYGTMRIGGTVIWETRFEEKKQTSRQGIKGGAKVVTYKYFGNLAIGLCEGEIAGLRRVWADGSELDLTTVEMRVYRGTDDQLPDPLLEAKQGVGNTPAYRGIAYVVFERLPLEPYGNRIPQLQFEVMRPVAPLNRQIRAMTLIPGATEYGLFPDAVTAEPSRGETISLTRHVLHAQSDFAASVDELQALCPNLENVALVVAWFGDDLRAGACKIRPCVVDQTDGGAARPWSVSGVTRTEARVISRIEGKSAYGGTPTDLSVTAAISDLKSRGLKVTLYPFVMMDIPAGNELPDPYGGTEQAAYPWRGRITGAFAPGIPGSTDKTAALRTEIEAFCGAAMPADFVTGPAGVDFAGNPDEFGYRRFVLHCATLAAQAGGVDAFLIGSELRGLTTLRDDAGRFPFVEALEALAGDVHSTLGPQAAITYGADWTEYSGHQPTDGSGDRLFHLDSLWAHPSITAVGIDNYMPIADWRDEDWASGNPDGAAGPADIDAMIEAIGAGEGHDWCYATPEDRAGRVRTPITDGAYGKPWVFRFKDLKSWWANAHYDRIAGVESPVPTAWQPASKPIWFTELGCPATDKGANQPNVFPDPKSSEDAIPYFSNGGRSDLVQARFLGAHMARWDAANPSHLAGWNPISPAYGGPMVDPARIYLWAWDLRPYPAFPTLSDLWGDHANYYRGHWLNGRLDGMPASALFDAILADHRLPPAKTEGAAGFVSGYLVDRPGSARDAIEPLIEMFGLSAFDEAGTLTIRDPRSVATTEMTVGELVVDGDQVMLTSTRDPDHDLPNEIVIAFRDPERDHQAATVRAVEPDGRGRRMESIDLAGAFDPGQAEALAKDLMRRRWKERNRIGFAVPVTRRDAAVGKGLRIAGSSVDGDWLVSEVEEGILRRISARSLDRAPPHAALAPSRTGSASSVAIAGAPASAFLDLPFADAQAALESRFFVAAWARPWRPQAVLVSPDLQGFDVRARLTTPATIGLLVETLAPGESGRLDRRPLLVELSDGELQSVSRSLLLNGANLAAVETLAGGWELLQFETAEEITDGTWSLSSLLRGQGGTTDMAALGAPAGSRFVLLNDAVVPAGLRGGEIGLELNWRVGPEGIVDERNFPVQQVVGGVRARLHLAPVHLRAVTDPDGIRLHWIRCGRFHADSWDNEEIPLDASEERYRLEIRDGQGAALASTVVAEPTWLWLQADVAAAFGSANPVFSLIVRQTSTEYGAGLAATRDFSL